MLRARRCTLFGPRSRSYSSRHDWSDCSARGSQVRNLTLRNLVGTQQPLTVFRAAPSRISQLPDDQKSQYNMEFERLYDILGEVESRLPYYAIIMNPEAIGKLMVMVS